jgi:hypothetical protein
MSEEMLRVEFYGIDGYCAACHQPLEGRSCPYCSWEDKSPSQHKYVKKVNTFDDFFAKCEEDPEFRREYLRVTMDETRDLILENKSLRTQLDDSNRKLEQRIAMEIDEHLKVVELQAMLDVAVAKLTHFQDCDHTCYFYPQIVCAGCESAKALAEINRIGGVNDTKPRQ